MNRKMKLWVAGTVGVLMAGLMSVNVYALEEKDVIGTWYVNELSMGGDVIVSSRSNGNGSDCGR
ncbi:MAG: hypothetical protein ACLURP_00865 [Ruminococcus sp.]